MSGRVALGRNLLVLYGGELAAKVLGFAVFAGYLAPTLGPERYGALEFGYGVVTLLMLVLEAGLGPYGAREAARDPSLTRALAGRIAGLRTALLVLALAAVAVVALLVRDPHQRALLGWCSLMLVPSAWLLAWVFQARDRMGVIAASSLLRQGVQAALVFAFVRGAADARWAPVAEALGILAAVGLQLVLYSRDVGRPADLLAWRGSGAVLRRSFPLAASTVAWAVRWNAPLLALGFGAGSAATGLFAAAHRLTLALHTFVWLWFFNLLPSLSRAAVSPDRSEWRRLMRRSLAAALPLAIGGAAAGALAAPAVVGAVYRQDYAGTVAPLQVLGLVLAIAWLSGHARFGLIAANRAGDDLRANLAGALASVAGVVVLGGALDPVRAAWVLVGAEAVTGIVASRLLAVRIEPLRRAFTRADAAAPVR